MQSPFSHPREEQHSGNFFLCPCLLTKGTFVFSLNVNGPLYTFSLKAIFVLPFPFPLLLPLLTIQALFVPPETHIPTVEGRSHLWS